jgi:peptide/nickel transport system substrate-binding protein/oligopeptide transport system substrate-binding protein
VEGRVRPVSKTAIRRTAPRAGLAIGTLLGLMLLASCGGGPGAPQPPPETRARGGVLRMIQEAPLTLDPLLGDSVYESLPVNQIFDTLIDFDPSLHLTPSLARSWKISRDGLLYSFELRENVRFHDGQPLTARDVAFSLLRNLRPGDESRSLAFSSLLVIEGARDYAEGRKVDLPGIRVVDDRTLEFRLAKPYNSFLELLAMDALAVVPERAVRELGEEAFGRAPVGTGPFRLAAWSEDGLSLRANPDHFRGEPALDGVEIAFLAEDETDFGSARFLDGKLDVLEPPTDSIERLSADPAVKLQRYQELSLSFLGLGTTQPPLDRPWLRRAVGHAIDRRGMVAESPSVRREAAGILPPGLPGYSPESKGLEYSPETSRRLLADAGHPGGAGLPAIRICTPTMGPAAARVLERIRLDLETVGLRLEAVPVSWAELGAMLEERTAPAFLLAWVADRTDPDAFLRSLFEGGGSANYFGYASQEVDALLDRGADEMRPGPRSEIYRELERRILADAPMVPLYHTRGIVAVRSGVHGLEPTPLGMAKVGLENVWIENGEIRP